MRYPAYVHCKPSVVKGIKGQKNRPLTRLNGCPPGVRSIVFLSFDTLFKQGTVSFIHVRRKKRREWVRTAARPAEEASNRANNIALLEGARGRGGGAGSQAEAQNGFLSLPWPNWVGGRVAMAGTTGIPLPRPPARPPYRLPFANLVTYIHRPRSITELIDTERKLRDPVLEFRAARNYGK